MERNFPFYIDPLSNLMDTNGTAATTPAGLSYYHPAPPPPPPPPLKHQSPASALPPNGSASERGSLPVSPYPVATGAGAAASEPVRRKRGRPRKYAASEQGGVPPHTTAAPSPSALSHPSSSQKKRDRFFDGGSPSAVSSSKKSSSSSAQLLGLGNVGQSFTPHIINVSAGEDVGQKVLLFMQQCKRELCILSASGSIMNASLRQPATSGGNITIEGLFDILSLSGSYVHTELGGKSGGLSVSLSSADGQIIGGGVGGPLKAAGPVQIIVGTFLMVDTKKTVGAVVKDDPSLSMLASPVRGPSASNSGFQPMETFERISARGSDDHQNVGGNHFMIPPQAMQMMHLPTTGWNARNSAYEPTGRAANVAEQSPVNGDYDQIPD